MGMRMVKARRAYAAAVQTLARGGAGEAEAYTALGMVGLVFEDEGDRAKAQSCLDRIVAAGAEVRSGIAGSHAAVLALRLGDPATADRLERGIPGSLGRATRIRLLDSRLATLAAALRTAGEDVAARTRIADAAQAVLEGVWIPSSGNVDDSEQWMDEEVARRIAGAAAARIGEVALVEVWELVAAAVGSEEMGRMEERIRRAMEGASMNGRGAEDEWIRRGAGTAMDPREQEQERVTAHGLVAADPLSLAHDAMVAQREQG